MNLTVQHPTLGTVEYNENIWSGKKQISINGVALTRKDKKTFTYATESGEKSVVIKSGLFSETKMTVDGETVLLSSAPKWYEIACSVSIFVFVLAWGNSAALCSIFPIVGGALGGAVSGGMMYLNLIAMKSVKKLWLKLAVWLAMLAGTVLICYLIALALVMLIAA